jgi:hypothetical protein
MSSYAILLTVGDHVSIRLPFTGIPESKKKIQARIESKSSYAKTTLPIRLHFTDIHKSQEKRFQRGFNRNPSAILTLRIPIAYARRRAPAVLTTNLEGRRRGGRRHGSRRRCGLRSGSRRRGRTRRRRRGGGAPCPGGGRGACRMRAPWLDWVRGETGGESNEDDDDEEGRKDRVARGPP